MLGRIECIRAMCSTFFVSRRLPVCHDIFRMWNIQAINFDTLFMRAANKMIITITPNRRWRIAFSLFTSFRLSLSPFSSIFTWTILSNLYILFTFSVAVTLGAHSEIKINHYALWIARLRNDRRRVKYLHTYTGELYCEFWASGWKRVSPVLYACVCVWWYFSFLCYTNIRIFVAFRCACLLLSLFR